MGRATGQSYQGLDMPAGQLAGNLFERVTYGDASDEERNKVRDDLEIYWGLDTEGMTWIVEKLFSFID